jgi:hypothetical protein
MTNFWLKSTIILVFLYLLKNKIIYNFMIFVATKKGRTKIFFPVLFWCCCWIRDPGSEMDKNQDPGSGIKIPDPQHCILHFYFLLFLILCLYLMLYLYQCTARRMRWTAISPPTGSPRPSPGAGNTTGSTWKSTSYRTSS